MIDVLMIYCFSVAALVSVAAFASERMFAALGWPRRIVWIAALAISLSLPLLMIVTGDSDVAPTAAASLSAIEVAPIVDSAPDAAIPINIPYIAALLQGVWLFGSGGLLMFALMGWLRLRLAARKWTSELVDGVEVQVADNLGPAVFGFFNPKIVVPRWLLDAPASDRSVAIAHERSHIAAGDTLLLLLGLLLVVIAPWNLPMWWQLRRLRFAIEVDCDQRVLRGGTSMATYGEMLLAVGQRNSRTPIGAMALTEPASQLERRIRIMTKGTIRHIKLLIPVSLAMSVSLVAVAAKLDAPPLSGIAPTLFASSVVTHEPPQSGVFADSAAVKSDASRTPVSATAQIVSVTQDAPVPAIDQPTSSAISTHVRSEENSPANKRTKVNAIRLAAVNPATEKLETTSTGSKPSASMDIGPKRIYTVAPIHPDSAINAGVYDGFVEIAFTVAVTGDVQNAEVTKSEPVGVFDESALTAIRQWRFEPAIKEGQAVPTHLKIRLKFNPSLFRQDDRRAHTQPSGSSTIVTTEQRSASAGTYTGEKLTLKFIDIDVRTVLKLVADTSGQNILISDKVTGKITLQLANVPWDEALDIIVREKGLVKRTSAGVMLIEPGPLALTAL